MAGYRINNKNLLCKLSDRFNFSDPSPKVYIKPLPLFFTEDGLREIFAEFGDIVTVKVVRNVGIPLDVVGFVRYTHAAAASRAILAKNATYILPNYPPITVKFAESDQQRAERKAILPPTPRYSHVQAPVYWIPCTCCMYPEYTLASAIEPQDQDFPSEPTLTATWNSNVSYRTWHKAGEYADNYAVT